MAVLVCALANLDWDGIRDWFVAAGTLGAASAAVWIGVLRPRLRRPSLSLHYDPGNRSDAQVVGIKFGSEPPRSDYNTRGAFARLRVRNGRGKDTAVDVEVLVETVRIGDFDPRAISDSESLGDLALPASNSLPTATRLSIPPGVERHFDFVHVRKREVQDGRDFADVILAVHPEPVDQRHRITAAGFEVDLVVAAANCDGLRYSVFVEWDSEWPEDENAVFEHLRVQTPRRR